MARKKCSELKKEEWIILDGAKCQIESVEISALGKHGSKKVRILAKTEKGEMKVAIKPAEVLIEVV